MAFPSSSATLVPRALALVKQRFPDVQVTFAEAEPPESLVALVLGKWACMTVLFYPRS